jgi:catalase
VADFNLYNKIANMNKEMTPERLMHEKGVGAYGTFYLYMPFCDYTKANFLSNPDNFIEVFVRFSRAMGQRGSAETLRDVRGMAVKFFTEQGIYDLVCQNMPVYFINDANKFPDLYKALRPNNGTSFDNEAFWSFMAENPESFHLIMWLFSNRGTINSYRFMEAYSVNTYQWENEAKETYYVRYKWNPLQGLRDISANEAEFLAGYDPDALTNDLYAAIESGNYPEYELTVQLVPKAREQENKHEIFNKTLIWSERACPQIKVGKIVINKLPTNFHDEVELAYFSPSNTVPGITIPDDDMLMAMCFAHDDSWRNRRR